MKKGLIFCALLIMALLPMIQQVKGAYLFEDDFELGNGYGGWTGTSGTPTIETDPVHCNTNSSMSDGTNDIAYYQFGTTYTELWARTYVRFDTNLPSNNEYATVLSFLEGGSYRMRTGIGKSSGGVEQVYISDIQWVTENFDYEADTWYCYEARWDSDADLYQIWIDGALILNYTEAGSEDVNRIYVGFLGSPFTNAEVNWDCVIADSSQIGCEPEGQDVTFNLFCNGLSWASVSKGVELGRSFFENSLSYAVMFPTYERWLDLTFIVGAVGRSWASVSKGVELGHRFYETGISWASVIPSFEFGVIDVTFILYETGVSWASVATSFEGVALDLTFILFATGQSWASLVMTPEVAEAVTITGVGLAIVAIVIACFAFIMGVMGFRRQ